MPSPLPVDNQKRKYRLSSFPIDRRLEHKLENVQSRASTILSLSGSRISSISDSCTRTLFDNPPKISLSETNQSWPWILIVLLWQVLSLLNTGASTFSELLTKNGIHAPSTQVLTFYIMLAIVYGSVLLYRNQWPQLALWKYCMLAVCDVEAQFLILLSFGYLSMTSVQLLDCFSIPVVMLTSRVVLGSRFTRRHYAGVALCLCGICLLVVSDEESSTVSWKIGNPGIGHVCVLLGATLIAVSNVFQEKIVKDVDHVEYLAMMGLFGTIVLSVQAFFLDWWRVPPNQLKVDHLKSLTVLCSFIGYALCQFIVYSVAPFLFRYGSTATVMNLSYLTSDFWSVVVMIFVFGAKLDALYGVAFIFTISGVTCYSFADKTRELETKYSIIEHGLLNSDDNYNSVAVSNVSTAGSLQSRESADVALEMVKLNNDTFVHKVDDC
eukprot:212962_1